MNYFSKSHVGVSPASFPPPFSPEFWKTVLFSYTSILRVHSKTNFEPFDKQRSICIFEVSTKILRLNCQFVRPRSPQKFTFKTKKQPHFFLRLEDDFFGALKPSLQCHQTLIKVGFHDKVPGLWAFEGQMLSKVPTTSYIS